MSFPRYPRYVDGGTEWLGQVPSDWAIKPLKHMADFINGEAFKPTEWEDSGTPIVRIQNLNGGDEFNFFNGAVNPRHHIYFGDLLFGWSGNRGTSFGPFVWRRNGLHYLNQHIFKVEPHECDASWFYWCLRAVTLYVEQEAHGIIGMVHVTKGRLGAISVPVPTRQEQSSIAAFLNRETAKIDELITEQQRLIELLKEKRQTVISHAVTKGLNPDASMKPSGIEWLGDVPAHWEVSRIANVFREVAEVGVDDLPILSVSIHHGVSDKEFEDEELDRKVTRSDDRSKYKRVAPGDLVYNMMRAWQGGFGTVLVEGMVSPAYVVARPQRLTETAYIEYLLRTPPAIEQMRRHSRGVTDFRLRLYWDEFKNLRIALPPLEEMKAICAKIALMDEKFSALSASCEKSVDVLRERRSALISAAVTGQIDVRGDRAGSATVLKPYTRGFARQLLAAEILSHCYSHPTTGRVKLQKLIHLCEHVAEIEEVGADYFRKAAGPFDNKLMFGIAAGLSRQGWFSEVKEGRRTFYRPLGKVGEHAKYLARWEINMPKVRKVLELLGKADTQQCEIVSTLYAAWNDLLIEKRHPSDAEIIREASDPQRWHESKLNIHPDKWPIALGWMREKGLIPTGFGTHTKHHPAEKESV